ncbi:MAG: CHAP domain-containing protein [Verrucomicrobiaceae bacterium]|nr:CHAP domain-containing protein [Verrucomicrobiaceae bacterium]
MDPNAVSQQCGAALILSQLGFAGSKTDDAPKEPAIAKYPGFVLKAGLMDSPHALQVQKRLNERGCGPVDEDGDFGTKTADAVRTFQAQSKDLDGNALTIDGEVGAITWAALFGKDSVLEIKPKEAANELLREVLKVAKSQLGVTEKPPGSNAGPEVEAYLKSAGASKGDPWCMAFVFWCFKQAATTLNIPNPCVKTAGVHDHWNRAATAGATRISTATATANPATVAPGMVFCINTGGGKGHTGFVLSVTGGTIETIEGNTNSGQGREGIAVMKHTRKINSISLGFVDYARS